MLTNNKLWLRLMFSGAPVPLINQYGWWPISRSLKIRWLPVCIEEHKAIAGRFDIGGVEVKFNIELVVGQHPRCFTFALRQIVCRAEGTTCQRLVLQIVERQLQIGKGLWIRARLRNSAFSVIWL